MENHPENKSTHSYESIQTPTEQVEDVVAAVDDALQHCRLHPDDASCDCGALHARICHTEIQKIFEDYEQHKVLTLNDLEKSIEVVLRQVASELEEDPEDQYILERQSLLKSRAREIDQATRRYVRTISKFFHIKKQQLRLDKDDFIAKFQEIDQVRRTAHNGLIETLTIYTRTVSELERYGALDGLEVIQWNIGDASLENEIAGGAVAIFSPAVLKNRDLVKDWAVSAHLSKRLHQLEDMQENAQQ